MLAAQVQDFARERPYGADDFFAAATPLSSSNDDAAAATQDDAWLNMGLRAASAVHPRLSELAVRAINTADMPFLNRIYAAARDVEMMALRWKTAEQHEFLLTQFRMQHNYFSESFADARFLVLTRGPRAIGRLYWCSHGAASSIIDLTLLSEECGQGLGTALLTLITEYADRKRESLTLQVKPFSPAHRLYRRFGFAVVADSGIYLKMQRLPIGGNA